MRLLLDTHVVIWSTTFEANLLPGERSLLASCETPCVSVVTFWEARLKWQSFHASGERKGLVAPGVLLRFVEALGWTILPLLARHAATDLLTPLPHRDPFDELLLAQAQVEGLELLTRDTAFRGHPLVLFA